MQKIRKLPIGIQNFEGLIKDGYLYVDKTKYIWDLISRGKVYFLSRPRRFGKSLLLSTLRAYFEGKKELFDGLYISSQETEWIKYPVFYFDFNTQKYKDKFALEDILENYFNQWENEYGIKKSNLSLPLRFDRLLRVAHQKTGLRCVVLVDEYDKSMLESRAENLDDARDTFKAVFSNLKSGDEHLKFVFITGVTKFTKVSIFSDLNQIQDISMSERYAEICGMTKNEIIENFTPEIQTMAEKNKFSFDECLQKLKKMYDGYHFTEEVEGVYNPFSLLNALNEGKFKSYWFETGTPTFLVEKIKQENYHIQDFTDGVYRSDRDLTDYRIDNPDIIPLFYQTGYLTIKGYEREVNSYLLKYPNEEVKNAFLASLVPFVFPENKYSFLDINQFYFDLRAGNIESVMLRLKSLFAHVPYATKNSDAITEQNFQNVIYLVFLLLGQFVEVEHHYSSGRADCVVQNANYVYLFEFKRDKTAEEAFQQIEEKQYAAPFASDKRTLLKIGASFSTEERTLVEWKIV